MTWQSVGVDIIMLKGLDSCLTLQFMSIDERLVQFLNAAELQWIKGIISNPKIAELAEKIDKVNPQRKESASRTRAEVFEV